MTLTDVRGTRQLALSPGRELVELDRPLLRKANPGPQLSQECELALVVDRAEFEAMEEEWNALFARAGQPQQLFQAYDWLWHWANHYLDNRMRLSIVVARQAGRLVMVWPLVTVRAGRLTRLCWMGEPVSQYGDVLVEEGATQADLLRQGWEHVKALDADVIYLRKTREDAVVFPLFEYAGALSIAVASAPYLDLASARDYEAYQHRYPAKKRARGRALLRGLKRVGAVAFEDDARGRTARELVDHALALKQKWLFDRAIIAPVLHDVRFGRFLRDVAANRNGAPDIRVSAVSYDGRLVAAEVSLECKRHRMAYLISYDVELAKYGVGVIVAESSIRTAHEQGCLRFDLLAPADPYKMDWADASVEVRDWAIPLSYAGRFYVHVWLRLIQKWIKRSTKSLPRWLRRRLAGFYRQVYAQPE